jgi:hypothetical protein
MIWGRSIFPSFDQALVYAEEKEEKTESTAAPGFTVIAGITGVLMSILVLNRKKGL